MGGQWAVLQSIAWTTMLAGNLRSSSLHEAVAKTFDGKHPCCLCKAVAAGRSSEQKQEFVSVTLKLEFPPFAVTPVLNGPAAHGTVVGENTFAAALTQKPATPPPRGSFA